MSAGGSAPAARAGVVLARLLPPEGLQLVLPRANRQHTGVGVQQRGLPIGLPAHLSDPDQRRNAHCAGQNGGVRIGAAAEGDKAQNAGFVQQNGLGGAEILCNQNEAAALRGVVLLRFSRQNAQQPVGNVPDVGRPRRKIGVVSSRSHRV